MLEDVWRVGVSVQMIVIARYVVDTSQVVGLKAVQETAQCKCTIANNTREGETDNLLCKMAQISLSPDQRPEAIKSFAIRS